MSIPFLQSIIINTDSTNALEVNKDVLLNVVGNKMKFGDADTYIYETSDDVLSFVIDNTTAMNMSTTAISIAVAQLSPTVHNTTDLGSASYNYKNVYSVKGSFGNGTDLGILTVDRPMGSFTKVWRNVSTTWVDYTAQAGTAAYEAFQFIYGTTYTGYIGHTSKFNKIYFNNYTNGAGYTLVITYSTGSGTWGTLTVTDGTSALSTSGTISFTPPGDWVTDTVNGTTSTYWVKITTSTTPSTIANHHSIGPDDQDLFTVRRSSEDIPAVLKVDKNGWLTVGYINSAVQTSSTITAGSYFYTPSYFYSSLVTTRTNQIQGLYLVAASAADATYTVQNSPTVRLYSRAWTGSASKYSIIDVYSEGVAGATTAATFCIRNQTINEVANSDYLLKIGSDKIMTVYSYITMPNIDLRIGTSKIIWYDSTSLNVRFGTNAGNDTMTQSISHVLIGSGAGTGLTTNNGCVFIGANSGTGCTSGTYNTGIGGRTLQYVDTGQQNMALGFSAMRYSTGSYNAAVGYCALQGASGLTSGSYNCVVGNLAASAARTAHSNIVIGYQSMTEGTDNVQNVYIGAYAGVYNFGSYNVAIGYNALRGTTGGGSTGNYNTVIGFQAGDSITTGTYNILLGYNVDTAAATTAYQFRLGYNTTYLLEGSMTSTIWIGTDYEFRTDSIKEFTTSAGVTVGSVVYLTGLSSDDTETYVVAIDNTTGLLSKRAVSTIGGGGITLANGADDRVVTATGASALNGEANLTFNGSTLTSSSGFLAGVAADSVAINTNAVHVTVSSTTYMSLTPAVTDGASAVAYRFNTVNSLANATARLFSVTNQGAERFYINSAGIAVIRGAQPTLQVSDGTYSMTFYIDSSSHGGHISNSTGNINITSSAKISFQSQTGIDFDLISTGFTSSTEALMESRNGYETTPASFTIRGGRVLGSVGNYNGGNIRIFGGSGLGTGTRGNIYFGDGSNGFLPAKGSETNVVYYDTATGKLSYGTVSTSSSDSMTLTEGPSSDHTASGLLVSMTAGESLAFGDLVYFKSDGKVWKANANSYSQLPAMGIATTTASANGSVTVLLYGIARDDSWTWTVGGKIYMSTTNGTMSQTAPTGSSDAIQVVGVATHADRMLFNPSYNHLELIA